MKVQSLVAALALVLGMGCNSAQAAASFADGVLTVDSSARTLAVTCAKGRIYLVGAKSTEVSKVSCKKVREIRMAGADTSQLITIGRILRRLPKEPSLKTSGYFPKLEVVQITSGLGEDHVSVVQLSSTKDIQVNLTEAADDSLTIYGATASANSVIGVQGGLLLNGYSKKGIAINFAALRGLYLRLGGGNDLVDLRDLPVAIPSKIYGFFGADRLIGGSGKDEIFGGMGDDVITGAAGDDYLEGGEGKDTLDGAEGNDALFGKGDDDVLLGAAGDDLLAGGLGDDVLIGGDGNDELRGARGKDELDGGVGNDQLFGGIGNDLLVGRSGDDRIVGGESDDVLRGGEGDDTLIGSAGQDTLEGGEGMNSCQSGEIEQGCLLAS
jgi:Ca2+-binding RTX toxin-like protein